MITEVSRHIKKEVERELWARAAGRCQFHGCNVLLYKSSITQETVNLARVFIFIGIGMDLLRNKGCCTSGQNR